VQPTRNAVYRQIGVKSDCDFSGERTRSGCIRSAGGRPCVRIGIVSAAGIQVRARSSPAPDAGRRCGFRLAPSIAEVSSAKFPSNVTPAAINSSRRRADDVRASRTEAATAGGTWPA